MNAGNASERQREFFSPRYQERLARWENQQFRKHQWAGGLWLGSILVLAGVLLLLQNLGIAVAENWWALFLMIPAIGSFGSAWGTATSQRRFTASAMDSLTGALLFTFVAVMFLYELDWELLWPLLLVIAGLGKMLSRVLPDDKEEWWT